MLYLLRQQVQIKWILKKDCVKESGLLGCDTGSLCKCFTRSGRKSIAFSSWTLKPCQCNDKFIWLSGDYLPVTQCNIPADWNSQLIFHTSTKKKKKLHVSTLTGSLSSGNNSCIYRLMILYQEIMITYLRACATVATVRYRWTCNWFAPYTDMCRKAAPIKELQSVYRSVGSMFQLENNQLCWHFKLTQF
jgi:hypothetical protein